MLIKKAVLKEVADLHCSEDTHDGKPCLLITDHMGQHPVLDINDEGVFLRYLYDGAIGTTDKGGLGGFRTVRIRNLKAVISDQATAEDIPERLKSEIIQEYRANTPDTHPDAPPASSLIAHNLEFIRELVIAGAGTVPIIKAIRGLTGLGLRDAKHLYNEATHLDTVLVRTLTAQGHNLAQVLTQLKVAEKSALERRAHFDWGASLRSAFNWEDSPQGWSFWHEVALGERIL